MKLKHFFLFALIFCISQIPAAVFAIEKTTVVIDGEHATSVYGDATTETEEQFFTFDPKLAPIKLEYVDFKINRNRTVEEWGKDIGQYNFKLFGCKRAEKNVVLNEGRAMRRDMKFDNVFFEELNELFPVIVRKDNPYFPYSISAERPDLLPGYVITAEIKDLFINVCDQYDWRTRTYSQLRSGSSEIKVLWRVMTPFNRKLYWEDTTRGYAEIQTPVRDGEVRLIEKAFADALIRLIGMPGFLETMRTIPDPEELRKAQEEFYLLANEHKKYKILQSSYRRKRTVFYIERERERVLSELEKMGALERPFDDDLDKGDGDLHSLQDLERRLAAGETLTPEELERLKALQKELAGVPLAQGKKNEQNIEDSMGAGLNGRGLSDQNDNGLFGRGLGEKGDGSGVFARLLTEQPLSKGVWGHVLQSAPLGRFLEEYALPGDLEKEKNKFGFAVSPVDGWITIDNQKPFRYLSPARIYRIRSSVVAVTNEEEVGSGLVISPSLVLTNYEIAKKTTYVKTEFLDGRVVPSMVLRVSKDKDVALLYMPPAEFDKYNWPIPLRLDLPEVGEKFYAIGTPMRGGYEGAMEHGKVAGYRFSNAGVDILTNTNVQSVTLGGILVDESGNAIGLAHAGKSLIDSRDGFIPIGDAFDALKVRIRDRDMDETPTEKAKRLRKMRDNYIK
ncbi:MAG: trypsin-like peptidase domain-containing protein [Alphaproteobacteria bacterium]|nr:trypsin-like peptidase domain-containing protein [Alphaproteobacteria bacterium]